MKTLLYKGRLLLPAVFATLLLTLAFSGTAAGWGDGAGEKERGEHAGSGYDNSKDGDHDDGKSEHGDEGDGHGDKDDNGHGDGDKDDDDGHDDGDKDDNGHGNGNGNGDKDDDNGHDDGDKDDDNGNGKDDDNGEGPGTGTTGPGGPVSVGGQVGAQTTPGSPAPTQLSPAVDTTPQAGEGGVLGQGGEAGPEVAQVQDEQGQPAAESQGAAQQQPSELASTGFNVVPLLVIGGLCVAASLLLLRRRTTA